MWLEPKNDLNVYKEENTAYGAQMSFETGVERPLSSLSLYGHSTQVTTTGAQLLNIPSIHYEVNGVFYDVNSDGSVTVKGTATNLQSAVSVKLKDSGYTAGEYYVEGSKNNVRCRIAYKEKDSEYYKYINSGNYSTLINFSEYDDILFQVLVEVDDTANDIVYPMLIKGNKPLPFEPYTGGKPSPSPEYPQPIITSGQDGTLEIGVDGGNLFPILEENLKSDTGLKGVINRDGSITVTGTPIKRYADVINIKLQLKKGFYTISGGDYQPSHMLLLASIERSNGNINYYRNETFEIYGNEKSIIIKISYESSVLQPVNYTIYPMLNVGSAPLAFEPYKPKQTLTIPTPNGLPGIPLSDDNTDITPTYIDKDGKGWVCDEIDLERGKYVQRVKEKRVLNTLVWKYSETTKRFYAEDDDFIKSPDDTHLPDCIALCTHFVSNKNKSVSSNDFIISYVNGTVNGFAYKYTGLNRDIELWKQFLSDNEVYILGVLETPVERDLTPEEIASYKSIQTYRPTTVISSDAWMQVGYYTSYMETKTNWKSSDFFNVQDYNRIKRNLNDIRWLALTLWPDFTFKEMGEDKSYEDYSFYADEINRFEANVEHICQGTFPFQVGERQTFYDNTPFIGWKELNRLEEACRLMYSNIKSRDNGRKMLPFTLNGGVL